MGTTKSKEYENQIVNVNADPFIRIACRCELE